MSDFQDLIVKRDAVVGVVGLGYVGLPLARTFWKAGFRVVGLDVDPEKIEKLSRGENYLKHLGEDYLKDLAESDRFCASADFSRLRECNAVIMCVPTPLDRTLNPDLSFVTNTAKLIAKHLVTGQLIVLESTTYPGTTRDVVLPILEQSGKNAGKDFYVAYSPEREDPGRKDASTQSIPKLVGGVDSAGGELARALYAAAIDTVVLTSSAEIAESAKLLENIYRSVNIALVNEMKVVLAAMGIDIWEVIDAAATKPFGFQAFYPGPGLGGHCIPIDPFYLSYKAREVGQATRFIELAGEINRAMPNYVIEKLMLALNEDGKAVRGSKILVLGLAYKPNVDDARESPSFELLEKLEELGAAVDYNDPHIPIPPKTREHHFSRPSVELNERALENYDAVLVATHHDAYDWKWLALHAKLIVDTRGKLREHLSSKARVVFA